MTREEIIEQFRYVEYLVRRDVIPFIGDPVEAWVLDVIEKIAKQHLQNAIEEGRLPADTPQGVTVEQSQYDPNHLGIQYEALRRLQ